MIYLDKIADIKYRAQLMPILTKKQEQIFTELDADSEERRTVDFGDEYDDAVIMKKWSVAET